MLKRIQNASTSHKVARNLRHQFDQQEFDDQSENENTNFKFTKNLTASIKKQTPQKSTLQQLPNSYILAMQSLQQSLQNKNSQIEHLQSLLKTKQQQLLESETKINQTLKKYKALCDKYEDKERENKILKNQIQEIARDKELAVKQASNLIQLELQEQQAERIKHQQTAKVKNEEMQRMKHSKQQRQRSRTINLQSNHNSDMPSYGSKQFKIYNELPSQTSSEFPLLASDKNKDYISYQRQILRNEKELIVLQYRMQALQSKLLQQSHKATKDELKQKLKHLYSELEQKQKHIQHMKNLI